MDDLRAYAGILEPPVRRVCGSGIDFVPDEVEIALVSR
jgi:hypothetical protein